MLAAAGAPTPFWIGADPAWTAAAAALGRRRVVPRPRADDHVALSHLAGDAAFVRNLATALAPFLATLLGAAATVAGRGRRTRPRARRDAARADLGPDVKVLDAPASLRAAVASFVGDDLVVGLRFHALVAAGMAGTRFVAVAHEPKLAGLARRLGQVSVPSHATAERARRARSTTPSATTRSPRRRSRGRGGRAPSARSACCACCCPAAPSTSPSASPARPLRRGAVAGERRTDDRTLSIGRRLAPVHLHARRPPAGDRHGRPARRRRSATCCSPSSMAHVLPAGEYADVVVVPRPVRAAARAGRGAERGRRARRPTGSARLAPRVAASGVAVGAALVAGVRRRSAAHRPADRLSSCVLGVAAPAAGAARACSAASPTAASSTGRVTASLVAEAGVARRRRRPAWPWRSGPVGAAAGTVLAGYAGLRRLRRRHPGAARLVRPEPARPAVGAPAVSHGRRAGGRRCRSSPSPCCSRPTCSSPTACSTPTAPPPSACCRRSAVRRSSPPQRSRSC